MKPWHPAQVVTGMSTKLWLKLAGTLAAVWLYVEVIVRATGARDVVQGKKQ